MTNRRSGYFFIVALFAISGLGCSQGEAQKNSAPSNGSFTAGAPAVSPAKPAATPATNLTAADVAKLKWIEGTWRGMDGDKPFFERYKIEETALVVESLKEDGSPDGEPSRFELKNGELGKIEGDRRSAASEITDTYVQFVAVPTGKGNNFRFVKQ